MDRFKDNEVALFRAKASKENYFTNFVWYNSYLEVAYTVPKDEFKGFKVPQWSMVSNVRLTHEGFVITLSLFKDSNFLYSIENALKYELIIFNT